MGNEWTGIQANGCAINAKKVYKLMAAILCSYARSVRNIGRKMDSLTKLFKSLASRFIGLFDKQPVHLAMVRRYADANGHYVGELYMYGTFAGIGTYRMIGASLDSFPLALGSLALCDWPRALDLEYDFLAPMADNVFRVGAIEPKDNEQVRKLVSKLPRRNIRLVIQNRFIERILENKQNEH